MHRSIIHCAPALGFILTLWLLQKEEKNKHFAALILQSHIPQILQIHNLLPSCSCSPCQAFKQHLRRPWVGVTCCGSITEVLPCGYKHILDWPASTIKLLIITSPCNRRSPQFTYRAHRSTRCSL